MRNTREALQGIWGQGLQVQDGSRLSCTDCLLEGNHWAGALAVGTGARLELFDSEIRGTLPSARSSRTRVPCASRARVPESRSATLVACTAVANCP